MKYVDQVYREQDLNSPPLADVAYGASHGFGSAFGQITSDARNLGQALSSFPYGSAFRVIGLITVVYIGFKVLKKFVNIEETVKKALRG